MPLVLGEIIGFGIHLTIQAIEVGGLVAGLTDGAAQADHLTNFIGVSSGRLSGNDAAETVSHQADFATFSAIEFLHTLAELRQVKMAVA